MPFALSAPSSALAATYRLPADWLVPDWPVPRTVRAVMTTRAGGVSRAPWDSMNLGDHVQDLPASVADNRAYLQQALGAKPVFLQQVHGSQVLVLQPNSADGLCADAALTDQPYLACTVMVADCLPVLFSTADGAIVAAAHAGWRGLASVGTEQDVLAVTLATILNLVEKTPLSHTNKGPLATKIIAWLGPCIGPSAFEVGPEVKDAFESQHPGASRFFARHLAASAGVERYWADLPGLAHWRLAALGVTQVYGNDGSTAWCTVSNPSRFFSHRRDSRLGGSHSGHTGRMAACVWRV